VHLKLEQSELKRRQREHLLLLVFLAVIELK
jgi:hypothetical protein